MILEEYRNFIGDLVLDYLNFQNVGVYTLALYLLCGLLAVYRVGQWPTIKDSVNAVLGILLVFTGIIIFCVFSLTQPAAMNKLSEEQRVLIGLVCTVVLIRFSLAETVSLFFRKKDAQHSEAGLD